MRNPLIKKQFMEIFKSYFVNQKTGEKRSKIKTVGLFLLFALLMIIISASFFTMSSLLVGILKADRQIHWIFFAVMSMLTIVLGVFGSVFNTYASLYLAKDNELLLSLPIPPMKILSSRIIGVYGLTLLYGGIVWVPACLLYWIFGHPSVLAIVFDLLMMFVIPVFSTVVTLALGFVVALISTKLKNKSYITVIITLAALGGYYVVWFRMTETFSSIVSNALVVGNAIKKWGNLFYIIGEASTGNAILFAIFTALSAALFAICIYILAKTFIRIATMNKGVGDEKVKVKSQGRQKKVSAALLSREFKKFTSSATYMLNCALGTVIAPIITIVVIVKQSAILSIIPAIKPLFDIKGYLPVILAVLLALIMSMNSVTTPSVSLEGKHLWILKSLPVLPGDVFKAKINLHLILTLPFIILAAVVIGFTLSLSATDILCVCILLFVLTVFEAGFGLMINIKRPNFNWTTETTPIKQSLNALIYMLVTWFIPAIIGGGFLLAKLFLPFTVTANNYILALIFIFGAITYLLNNWIYKKGVKLFEEF